MKINTLLFSLIILPLFVQCNSITRKHKNHKLTSQSTNIDEKIVASADTSINGNDHVQTGANKNPFGILINKTNNAVIPVNQKIVVAKALGLNYVRVRVDMNTWSGVINDYDAFASAGFKIMLNINSGVPRTSTGEKQALPFPTDMEAFSKTFTSILDKYKPELVVVENEEDNPGYHSGSADDYINELKTAIAICHSKGLKVTNGGLTVREVVLLVFDDLMRSGKKDEAYALAQHSFPQQYLNKLDKYQNMPMVQRGLTFGRQVIDAYKTLDLDYVNFHWYEPIGLRGKFADNSTSNTDHLDPAILNAAINYLKRKTGKPVITNEFGVLNTSPTLIQELMQAILNANMDYAIFYSGDGGAGATGGAKALQNSDASLRETGEAVKNFIQQHCK